MADVTKEQVVDFLSKMSVMDLAALTKELGGQVGRQGGSGCGGRRGRRPAPAAAALLPAAEQTEFTVILLEAGANKIEVIKAVREIQNNFRARKSFAKIAKIIDIPNLIDIQKQSYEKFLQKDIPARQARGRGPSRASSRASSRSRTSRRRRRSSSSATPRQAEVRRRRVPPARHDVRGADQGRRPPGRLGHQRGDRRAVDPRRQGAGGLLRRDPADDRERHLHHQRHRARRRQPAAPQPGRLLRPRQGQDPLLGQAALQRPRHPVPRLVARLRVRSQGLLYVRIDRRRKLHATVLLRALGYSTEELLNYYYDTETVYLEAGQEVREVGRVRSAARPARQPRHPPPGRARSSSRRTASSPSSRSRS
jgi:DNA-directed RNA polymerase subunit beta